jgi:hypothetical protein
MSTARLRHEALLVELHREMKEGRGDGDRANEIGDEMNLLWEKLDDDERDLFDALSEDLYLIEGKRRVVALDEGETIPSVRTQMEIALEERRDRDALALARKLPELGPRLVDVIGGCWERLGFDLGAKCFHDFAITLRFPRVTRSCRAGSPADHDDSDALRPASAA